MQRHRLITFLCTSIAISALCGCGSGEKTGIVTGNVTVRSKAPTVSGMTVSFVAPSGRVVMMRLGEGGEYRCEVPAGELYVSVSHPHVPSRLTKERPKAGDPKGQKAAKELAAKLQFDTKYLDPWASGLKTTVEAGKEQVFNIDLR